MGWFGWLIRKIFAITYVTRPWIALLAEAWEFSPTKISGKHLPEIVGCSWSELRVKVNIADSLNSFQMELLLCCGLFCRHSPLCSSQVQPVSLCLLQFRLCKWTQSQILPGPANAWVCAICKAKKQLLLVYIQFNVCQSSRLARVKLSSFS